MSESGARREREGFASQADLDELVRELERFERGESTAEEWRAFRLLQGAYDQRQGGDLHMLRTKLPQGLVTAEQLEVLAEVAEAHSRGFGHVSTRQNLQLHFVTARGVEGALRRLADVGITSKEACGNSVRNITACPYGGVGQREVFDATPYGEALTRHWLRHPLASSLPRKFKIALEGCCEDHAAAAIHDIALFARLEGGRRGFEVRLGGGTATLPVTARPLLGFLPAGEVLALAEAVARVFHRLGERKNRKAARLKYLVKRLGWEGFQAEVLGELGLVRAAGVPALPFDAERPPEEGPPAPGRPPPPSPRELAALVQGQAPRGPGVVPEVRPVLAPSAAVLAAWARTNVRPQRQAGWVTALVTVPLGDLTSAQLTALARLARAHADGTVRFTREQDVLLRWIRAEEVPALYAGLAAAGLGLDGAGTPADVVSCPGAETCRLAVTQSRGLGQLVEAHLRAHPDVAAALGDADVKASGCPNGCSQHHVAAIGLQGSLRKVGEKAVPQYFVLLGGGISPAGARFGRLAAKIPARRVPQALERLARLREEKGAAGEGARDFFARVALGEVKAALADLSELSPGGLTRDDLVDLGETEERTPASGADADGAAA
jgi:sulfite reductase (ferredoxin)